MSADASKPRPQAWFASLSNPDERYGLDEVVYTDANGGLLQVVHDMDELRKTSGAEWRGRASGVIDPILKKRRGAWGAVACSRRRWFVRVAEGHGRRPRTHHREQRALAP